MMINPIHSFLLNRNIDTMGLAPGSLTAKAPENWPKHPKREPDGLPVPSFLRGELINFGCVSMNDVLV